MIVDAHHHLWRISDGYSWLDAPELAPIRRSFLPADLLAELAAAGVDRTVLVEGGRCDTGEAEILLGYAAGTPAIAGVVAWADPADPELAATIAGYRALPGGELLVGVRPQLQAETDPGYLDRPAVRRGLRTVAEAGLAFDVVCRADQLPAVARVAREVPQLRFVLDHLGKPGVRDGAAGLAGWAGPLAELAASPNVTAKLSGLVTEADWRRWLPADLRPFVAEAVRLFGPERLMFGSDWPVCRLAAGYGDVLTALTEVLPPLSTAERSAVFGATAVRTYRLRD
ncbi:amidohydrolase family protein [Micromonospora sp. WMMD1102]|uniref:amidohydrolase family protein n=1 Tax=Micromonospora sp. WMMD1102 TaxID=3016105 RepID=UPI002414D489|nr:amidohydrolase family protein [Micromonospora sp. WMMD1102]MDG4787901.1 amidohydrolase family protein [Micromonospora sp. WMMD1102]